MTILYWSEEAIHERPHVVWIHSYEIPGVANPQGQTDWRGPRAGEIEGHGEPLWVGTGILSGVMKTLQN